ncbi:hypothetical protein [Haloplanus salilacus]
MTGPTGIAVSDAFADYLEDLRRTVHFPRCASLRQNRGTPSPNPGFRLS